MKEIGQLSQIVHLVNGLSPEGKNLLKRELFGDAPKPVASVGHVLYGSARWKRHIGKSMVHYWGRMTPTQRKREITRRFGR